MKRNMPSGKLSPTSLRRISQRRYGFRLTCFQMNVTRPCYDPKQTGMAPAWEEIGPVELTRARIARFSCEFALCVRAHVFAERRGLKAHGPYSRFYLGTRLPREQRCHGRRILLTQRIF